LTPEADGHLRKAHQELAKARATLKQLGYGDEAGRLAYLAAFRGFLSDGFDLKIVSDYGVGPDATVSSDEAETAIRTATRFVDRITEILA
jgi:hypothetical protein